MQRNGSNWNEEVCKIVHTEEIKEESVFSFETQSHGDRKDNTKCSEVMKEMYNMSNETFQREKTSQNKYLRLKMLKYSIGRKCNE